MSTVFFFCFKVLNRKLGRLSAQLIGAVLSELVMMVGYYVFEGVLYGFVPSLVNIPANAVQGVAGFIIGIALIKLLEKTNVKFK